LLKVGAMLALMAYGSTIYPVLCGGWRHRTTSLRWTFLWLIAAWASPLGLALATSISPGLKEYLFLCLTACVVVSLLGAKFPGAGLWNAVVAAFLLVKLMPVFEQGWDAPHWHLDPLRGAFLGIVLAIGVLNYVPTRLGPWVMLAGLGLLTALGWLPLAGLPRFPFVFGFLAVALWGAYVGGGNVVAAESLAGRWLSFRDRYGVVWALRVKEEFNAAARHAGLKAQLDWWGDTTGSEAALSPDKQQEMLLLLRKLLWRFDGKEGAGSAHPASAGPSAT